MTVTTDETENQEALLSTKLEIKLQLALEGLNPFIRRSLLGISKRNSAYILDYVINELKRENNASVNYVRMNIYAIVDLVKYCKKPNIKTITRENVLSYLDSLKKTETQDPMHKWIGTHSLHRVILTKFFKWLYYSDIEPKERPSRMSLKIYQNIKGRRFQITNLQTYHH
jgi:hypothetical protein